MNISANVSSLQANQTFMNNNAHNVANVNTDGFVPTKTNISDAGGSIQAKSSLSSDNGSATSQTDLNKEITDQVVIENVNEVNIKAIQTQDQMLGSLLDIIT